MLRLEHLQALLRRRRYQRGFLINPYVFAAGGSSLYSSLLHFNGADASTTMTDASGLTWTAVGNAQLDTAQQQFGSASLQLDGTGDYVDATADARFTFGTGDFTIEAWVRFGSVTGNRFLWGHHSNHGVYSFNVGTPTLAYFNGASNAITIAGAHVINTWYHVALTRQGTTMRLFLNGTKASADFTSSVDFNTTNFRIGAQTTASGALQGHIDEFRLLKGLAVYTANFTPPASPFVD